MLLSRRSMMMSGVVSGVGAVALSGCSKGGGDKAIGTRKIAKVGLQTYTLREMMGEDFIGTFRMIKDIGYDYVELNDRNFRETSAEDLRVILDDIGLPAHATHMGYDLVVDDTANSAKITKTLGVKYAIVPYIGEDKRELSDWKTLTKRMNEAAKVFTDSGVKLAYHNHQFEFDDLGGGTTAMSILLNELDPDRIDFELDMFWARLANVDIPDLFKKNPGRFKLCHIKDMKGDPRPVVASGASYNEITDKLMVNVGEGEMDFGSYFALNDISGMEYFIAEHDAPVKPHRDAVNISLNTLRALRF